jgi:hypothetical protein
MKKNWIYLLLFMVTVAIPLASCSNDDEPNVEEERQHDPESDADQTPVEAYDALEWLQGSIVIVEEDGDVYRRVNGKTLDDSQPMVISIPVSDFEAAEETFLSWVAPGKEVTQVEGGYDYHLTDAEGKAQGSVSFRTVKGEVGVMARMSVADGTALKQVSEVNFVDSDLWPENASIPIYEAGKRYKFGCEMYTSSPPLTDMPGADIELDDYWTLTNWEEREFYCIQGNDNGKEAILVWLLPEKDGKSNTPGFFIAKNYREIDCPVYTRLSSVAEAQKVLDFYNENYDAWQKMLKEMDALGYYWSARIGIFNGATGNSEFLLNSYDEKKNKIKCLDLDEKKGEICDVSDSSWFTYRYMHIRIFPPATH